MNNTTSNQRPPPITLYVATGTVCNNTQTVFPSIRECCEEKDFLLATMYDYTNIRFEGGKRGGENFVGANCLVGDMDNTHSEDSNEWVDPSDIGERLHGVPVFYQFSRNHQKIKDGKSPRPKFHFCIPITYTTNPNEYNRLWRLLKAIIPELDPKTKDLGRFFFGGGQSNKGGFFPGTLTLNEFCEINEIKPVAEETGFTDREVFGFGDSSSRSNEGEEFADGYIIQAGERNNKLFKFACKYYRQDFGNPKRDQAVWEKLFRLATEHCNPRFPLDELKNVIRSAKSYTNKEHQKMVELFLNFADEED